MSKESDRRAPGAARVAFDGMVEVGGSLGPSFEARAIDLSGEGMHLATAYLPDIGQPVTCRFDVGGGAQVVAAGEVLWREDQGDGGEFGIRFTNLDGASASALERILSGPTDPGAPPDAPVGAKVRLHIDGLASPMRARVKDSLGPMVTAFSELGFLQMGKPLDLEDTTSGSKRPAIIDRVSIEVEPENRIPQLVVTLLYDDEAGRADRSAPEEAVIHMPMPEPMHADDVAQAYEARAESDEGGAPADAAEPLPAPKATAFSANISADAAPQATLDDDASPEPMTKLKGAIARGATAFGPAMSKLATRAKTTVALLAAKRRGGSGDDVAIPMRRTTAPPPDGALHTSGRKVVRGEPAVEAEETGAPKFKVNRKRAMAIGAIGVAAILAGVALRKPAPPVAATAAPVAATAALAAAPVQAQEPAPQPTMTSPFANAAGDNAAMAGGADFDDEGAEPASPVAHGKKGKPASFGNGPVGKGNVLRLKMDGPIDRILGAAQPTGFAVVIPGRKSLDAAGPLAARDPRIASIEVANEGNGAQLTVAFKDGVPNYKVRAKGSSLEIVLANPKGEARAKHSTKKKRHGKRH
jgi:hypothetical protein